MARPTKEQIIEIITKKSKNHAVVDAPRRPRSARAEAGTPDIVALRQKWIGEEAAAAVDELENLDEEDLASVTLKPNREDALDQVGDDQVKEAIVSGSTGEIVGKQG